VRSADMEKPYHLVSSVPLRPDACLVNRKIVLYGTVIMNGEKCTATGRRESRRQDRRETIVIAASRHFLDHGYSGTTMSAIAATLGGSKGTLWSYFPSKEELFTAVIDHASTAFRAQLSEILDLSGDLPTALRCFSLKLLEKVTSPDAIALNRLVTAEAGRFPEAGRIFFDRAPWQTVVLLAEFLSGVMERGQLRRDNPVEAAQTFMHLCVSRLQQQCLLGLIPEVTAGQREREVERAVPLFLRAYAPDGAGGRLSG